MVDNWTTNISPKNVPLVLVRLNMGLKITNVSLEIGGKGQKRTTHVVWSVVCLCFNGPKNYKCKSKKMWGRLKMCGVLAQ